MSTPNPYNPNPQGGNPYNPYNPSNPRYGVPRQGNPQHGMPPYNSSQRGQYGQPYGQYGQPRRPEPPHMPQMQPNLPYGRPPRKPKRTISGGGVAAIIVSVLLVLILLIVLLFGGGLIFYSKKIDEATADGGSQIDENKPKAGSIDAWYNISERPDYQTTIDYIHKLAKETKQAVEDDEKGFLKDNDLPYNKTNREYVETYVHMLQAYDEYKTKDSELNSVDTQELDDMISYRKTQVDQIVEQFDKHERLGAKIVATDEEGGKRDVYTDTRTNMRKAWDEHEQQVAQYQYNGNDWIGAAKEAARLAGMEIDWNIYDADKVCTPQDYTYVQALYCPHDPEPDIRQFEPIPLGHRVRIGDDKTRDRPPRHPHALRNLLAASRHVRPHGPHRSGDQQLRDHVPRRRLRTAEHGAWRPIPLRRRIKRHGRENPQQPMQGGMTTVVANAA